MSHTRLNLPRLNLIQAVSRECECQIMPNQLGTPSARHEQAKMSRGPSSILP